MTPAGERLVYTVQPIEQSARADQRWEITLSAHSYPIFRSRRQQDAVSTAVKLAKEHRARGGLAQVRVKGRDGKFQTEWTYGKDPERTPG